MEKTTQAPPNFRPVPRTGVIYVMTEAERLGYKRGSKEWANLGQGAPEISGLADAPERIKYIEISEADYEYAPVDGLAELREAIANLYNSRYREGKSSKYSKENVAISSGGRLALTRLVSTLGRGHLGHFLPDYTAYEELLDAFQSFSAIPILRDAQTNYAFSPANLKSEILGRGLSSVLLSNPSNPTGTAIHGKDLASWVKIARELECTMLFDEFYSHYLYPGVEELEKSCCLSATRYVDDVDEDPVIVFDGLTKNWRYPGFRLSWTLGPRSVIEAVASAGSFLDGGSARPIQKAAVSLVERKMADQEARAIQKAFLAKRDLLINGLKSLGIVVNPVPQGGFYCWGDLSGLPNDINTGMSFFKKALEAGVIVVPGVFFDINPGRRRPDRASRFGHYARFSFGPNIEEIERALNKLRKVIV